MHDSAPQHRHRVDHTGGEERITRGNRQWLWREAEEMLADAHEWNDERELDRGSEIIH
jgi:hypothetical protein